jgi:hypothetical protein
LAGDTYNTLGVDMVAPYIVRIWGTENLGNTKEKPFVIRKIYKLVVF